MVVPTFVSRLRRYGWWLLPLAYMAFIAAVSVRHEMWGDEMQAWVLARDMASPLALLSQMKYEGHPCLWHLLLEVVTRFTHNPAWMQVLNVALASAGAWILVRFAPFPLRIRAALLFGYFLAFEWSVIARNYALGVMLLFIFCALYAARWRRLPLLALVLGAVCHTNVCALLIAIALTGTLALEAAVGWIRRDAAVWPYRGRIAVGGAILALGIVSAVLQLRPHPDHGYLTAWNVSYRAGRVMQTTRALVQAYVPTPRDTLHFWQWKALGEKKLAADPDRNPVIPTRALAPTALAVLAVGGLFFVRRRWALLPYLGATAALLAFFYTKYTGMARHHGHIFLAFVIALWLSAQHGPSRPSRLPWVARVGETWERQRWNVLLLLLLVHIHAAWTAVKHDWREPFSQGKAVAQWIRAHVPKDALIVGDQSFDAMVVLGYLQGDRLFDPVRGAFHSYVTWDKTFYYNNEVLPMAERQARVHAVAVQSRPPVVLVLNWRPPPDFLSEPPWQHVAFEGAMVDRENYYVYYRY